MLRSRLLATPAPAASAGTRLIAALRSHRFVLFVLAAQYVLVQLTTGAMYGDAPRNLHWGLLTAEQPRFLIDQPDPYQRVLGFAPPAPELAPRGLYHTPSGKLHPWWGPVAPLLFAAVWISTHSYTLLRLVVPLVAGIAVLLVFRMADRLYGRRQAWLAAAFFACFPLYRDYASTSYIEAFSTAVLAAALYAYWQGRTSLAVVAAQWRCTPKWISWSYTSGSSAPVVSTPCCGATHVCRRGTT